MLRSLLVTLLIASVAAALASWIISPEMAVNWALARLDSPDAILDAQAGIWLGRLAGPALALVFWLALRYASRTERALRALGRELSAATRLSGRTNLGSRLGTGLARATLAAWLLLAADHWGAALRRVVHEWPVYRFRDGEQVLPNMSESNRDVIRYVAAATPDDARILVASDQTLFFLSYYLWPREIDQRRHPDSEFTVPQPGRQLAAYRLGDLTDEDLAALDPDFVLEYFEGPQFVEPERLLEDRQWIAFARQLHADPTYVPEFNVRLRPISELRASP